MPIYKILQKSPKLAKQQFSLQDPRALGCHGSGHLWKRDFFLDI